MSVCKLVWRSISHYRCEIQREDGKMIATVESAVMTLKGDRAQGR
ncbi:hypothetical protein [Alcaligenes faecalis]|nr:hypothetical protein [Alcaligenes faecalis]